jgi:glucosyl-dolichyl phosphate glucuronosyltransferase
MLTILFSTYNGMQTLPRMIERLQIIERPDNLQIIAVDNRSDDGSRELLLQASAVLPITVFECREPGKNKALNYALDRIVDTIGDDDLVVVTDDDILPNGDWLMQLSSAAAAHPKTSVFGGAIRPVWPANVPRWLPDLEGFFAVLFATTSARTGPCTSRDIYGPNMAVRGRLFKQGIRFNPSIGPDGSQHFGMGSESELLRRLERDGHVMHFSEAATVGHQIKPSLLRWNSVLSRAFRYGRGLGMLDGQERSSLKSAGQSIQRVAMAELKALATILPGLTDRRARVMFRREIERGRIASLLTPNLNLSAVMRKVTRSVPVPVPAAAVIARSIPNPAANSTAITPAHATTITNDRIIAAPTLATSSQSGARSRELVDIRER